MKTSSILFFILLLQNFTLLAQEDLFQDAGELYGQISTISVAAYQTYCDTGYIHVDTLSHYRYMDYIYPNQPTFCGVDMFVPRDRPVAQVDYTVKGKVAQKVLFDGENMEWYAYLYDWRGRLKEQASAIGYVNEEDDTFDPFFSMQRKFKPGERRKRAKAETARQTGYRVYYDQHNNPSSRAFFDDKHRLLYSFLYSPRPDASPVHYPDTTTINWKTSWLDNGQPWLETGYNENGEVTQSLHFTYDKNNMPLTEIWKDRSGKETFRWNYLYDDKRQLLEVEAICQGKQIFKYLFAYNAQQHIVQLILETPGEQMVWASEYEYDETGNWVMHYLFLENGPTFYSEREMEYY